MNMYSHISMCVDIYICHNTGKFLRKFKFLNQIHK